MFFKKPRDNPNDTCPHTIATHDSVTLTRHYGIITGASLRGVCSRCSCVVQKNRSLDATGMSIMRQVEREVREQAEACYKEQLADKKGKK